MANEHVKRCSMSFALREMQFKIATTYQFISASMAEIKKVDAKCWRGRGDVGTLVHCPWECEKAQLLWETAGRSPRRWHRVPT